MKRRVLVTGGFGFLGGRIAQQLATLPNLEIAISSRSPKETPKWLPDCRTIELDVCDEQSVHRAVEGVDTVIHFASLNDQESNIDVAHTFDVTTIGTMRLVDAAILGGVKRFIYQSTVHVYGRNLVGRVTEKTIPAPITTYAISHLAAEHYVSAVAAQGKISGVVLRCANGFGFPTHKDVNAWHLLVNGLCKDALENGILKLRSNGEQRRDFITLTDISLAFAHLVNLKDEQLGDGIFNLGPSVSTSVFEMAERIANMVEQITGARLAIERPMEDEIHTQDSSQIDVSKLSAIGFRASNDYDSEIRGIVEMLQR
ncbi:MAG: NAD-dependent epimerase/dehydratase family protein [Acidimicrobiaceae bacterium]|nr:NAD-dependent epimerase/dehydratase family protein [Acidimicrobiaceae bacterium]